MTGFESKRQAAQDKVQEEMQVIFTQRQTARIVDLQTHIENFDGEDR